MDGWREWKRDRRAGVEEVEKCRGWMGGGRSNGLVR